MKATNAARKAEAVTAVIPATIYQFPRRNPHLRTSIAMWLDHVDQEQDKKLQWEILEWLRNLSRELRESGGSVDWRLLLFAGVSTLAMVGVLVWNQPKVEGFYAPADVFRVIAQLRGPCPAVARGDGKLKKIKPKQMYSPHDIENIQEHDYSHMDEGIRATVKTLVENGIETVQSCQGGKGHCYPEPIVEFCGGYEAGFRAFAIARTFGLKVHELRRVWSIQDGEPVGPHWAMTFYETNH